MNHHRHNVEQNMQAAVWKMSQVFSPHEQCQKWRELAIMARSVLFHTLHDGARNTSQFTVNKLVTPHWLQYCLSQLASSWAWAYALQLLAFHFQTFIASAGNQMKNINKTSAKLCSSSFISSWKVSFFWAVFADFFACTWHMFQIKDPECPQMTMNNEDEAKKCLYDNGHIYRDHQSSPNNQELYSS